MRPASPSAIGATEADPELLDLLKDWRMRKARVSRRKPYQVLHNRTLEALASVRPKDLTELAAITGIGPAKLERYGEELLRMVQGDEGNPLS